MSSYQTESFVKTSKNLLKNINSFCYFMLSENSLKTELNAAKKVASWDYIQNNTQFYQIISPKQNLNE